MKALVPVLALFTAISALAAPGTASAETLTAYADLNGDGTPDQVSVSVAADNPNEQSVIAKIGRRAYVARAPLASEVGVRPLRVVDVNGDGREEVLVTESVGANTEMFTIWSLDSGWRPVRLADGSPLRLWEGGGISAISRYGCTTYGPRELNTVSAELVNWEHGVYVGAVVGYAVSNGIATEMGTMELVGNRDLFVSQADPSTCE
jgi:hypothetical protein